MVLLIVCMYLLDCECLGLVVVVLLVCYLVLCCCYEDGLVGFE